MTDEVWDLIQRCWAQDPLWRPKALEMVHHLRCTLTAENLTDKSCLLVEDGTTSMGTLPGIFQDVRRSPVTLGRFFSRFRRSGLETLPPIVNGFHYAGAESDTLLFHEEKRGCTVGTGHEPGDTRDGGCKRGFGMGYRSLPCGWFRASVWKRGPPTGNRYIPSAKV